MQCNRFDPHFNAITGLNGSGKSNILDSICFVLGITNLSQVRAGNLSELVYKQGQAGVNKASVTVVFNNEDESTSPVGYEQCPEMTVTRQVLLGGRSKYLINGRNAPAGQVANLFHSVQLNVNNPHFLIMQGRITKVLNMKPPEILSMVEEAAGTRMFETKKQAPGGAEPKPPARAEAPLATRAEAPRRGRPTPRYGFTGAAVGQLPCLPIASTVTAYGRDLLLKTKEFVETKYTKANGYANDAEVVYGDTDSVMVNFGFGDVAATLPKAEVVAAEVTKIFPPPVKLEFEKVYFPYLLMNKKRYAGLYWTRPDKWDKLDAKGIETVRRDNCRPVCEPVANGAGGG